ncbi:MAG: DUF4332 domain-containing protein [Cyanobacteria bacterium J06600_6]
MKSQYWSIALLPGLHSAEQKLLEAQGISNTQELLKRTQTPESRIDLASKLKLNQKRLSKWIALADLGRIPSVGSQYCGLILHAGIISAAQLSQTPFHRLHAQISRLQVATLRRKDLTPSVGQVKQWVEQAKILNQHL